MKVVVLYFAGLAEAAGCASEPVVTQAADLAALYAELDARHGFGWPLSRLRVAMNGAFVRWEQALEEHAEVAFIPPVSGG